MPAGSLRMWTGRREALLGLRVERNPRLRALSERGLSEQAVEW